MLNFIKPHDEECMTGYYWDKKPSPEKSQAEERKTFRYSKATGKERRYNTAITNLRLDSEIYQIKSYDDCGFKVGGYVSTQNGSFWIIESIIDEEQTDDNKESFLLWKSAVKTEHVLRLRRMDNPWGIG